MDVGEFGGQHIVESPKLQQRYRLHAVIHGPDKAAVDKWNDAFNKSFHQHSLNRVLLTLTAKRILLVHHGQ